MAKTIQNQFNPDYASPPGETLLETLEALEMSQADLAKRTGRPLKTINEIIHGKAALTPDTALQLEKVLNIPASFWINRESRYREFLARQAELTRLNEDLAILKQLPIKQMRDYGWIPPTTDKRQQLAFVLRHCGVASPAQLPALGNRLMASFRKSPKSDSLVATLWIRQGEIEAAKNFCAPYDAHKFRTALGQIRSLTLHSPDVFQPQLKKLCAEAGVAVVFVRELPKAGICGATKWLKKDKAMIQLSLRYKTNDHLWFTFFHEAAHLLLHSQSQTFYETDNRSEEKEEIEANQFAADFLIPPDELTSFLAATQGRPISKVAINRLANRLGIAPGIVVGRLQHEKKIPPSHCNDLKIKLVWVT